MLQVDIVLNSESPSIHFNQLGKAPASERQGTTQKPTNIRGTQFVIPETTKEPTNIKGIQFVIKKTTLKTEDYLRLLGEANQTSTLFSIPQITKEFKVAENNGNEDPTDKAPKPGDGRRDDGEDNSNSQAYRMFGINEIAQQFNPATISFNLSKKTPEA